MSEPVLRAEAKYPLQEWYIPTSKEPQENWVVGLWSDYKFTCTCPSYKFKDRFCKHTQAERLELESLYGSIFNYVRTIKKNKER